MASYVLDEFLGAGALKGMGQKFADDGWDDVPTLKVIDAEDMEALELTDAQRVSGATAPYPQSSLGVLCQCGGSSETLLFVCQILTRFIEFQDALELRIHLHNRLLMKYADRMEASRMGLIKLMSVKPVSSDSPATFSRKVFSHSII
jgi:hypothetical protein